MPSMYAEVRRKRELDVRTKVRPDPDLKVREGSA